MSKYDFEMNMNPGSIPMLIMDQIALNADVLEFGCANGRMTKFLRNEKNCNVSIIERDEEAFAEARYYAVDGICGDIEEETWCTYFSGKKFDYILFADVLEHLKDAEKTLKKVKPFLKDDGKVLISMPNIAHNDVIASLYNNSFAYREIGLLDNTHIHFWGKNELPSLAENTGFFLEVLDGDYQSPFTTELKDSSANISENLKALLKARAYNDVYQFFLVFRKREFAEENKLETIVRLKNDSLQISADFYWDLGEGYQAGLYTSIQGDRNQNICVFRVTDIPAECQKVRFDPPGEDPLIVENCYVCFNCNETCEISPLNGIPIGHNTYLFWKVHAQMEFILPPSVESFTVTAKIIPCSPQKAEYFTFMARKQEEERVHNHETIIHYSTEVAKQIEKNNVLLTEKNSLQLSNQHLLAENADLHEKNLYLMHNVNQLSEDNKTIALEKAKLEQQVLKLQEISVLYSSLQERNKDLENAYLSAESKAHEAEKIISAYEQLEQAYKALSAQYAMVQMQYTAISTSQFWKITAPLRTALDKIKATKAGTAVCKTILYYRAYGIQATLLKIFRYLKKKKEDKRVIISDGIEKEFPFQNLKNMLQAFEEAGASIHLKDKLLEINQKKKILIVSHELNLTGAPVAIESMAKALHTLGKEVIIVSPHDGALRERLSDEQIPTIVYDSIYRSNLIKRSSSLFQMIVVSTNVGAPLIAQLSGFPTPVIWWIHESRASYPDEAVKAMPNQLGSNIHVFCGGAYAQNLLAEYCPSYSSNLLLYCTPDHSKIKIDKEKLNLSAANNKVVFALVGMLEQRKGQDILAEAIRMLSEEMRQKCYFVFVGRPCYPPQYTTVMDLCRDYPDNVQYIEELKKEELMCLYQRMNCLICASRDDPMPIVVADAMALSKPIICSKNTGSAALLEETSSGLVYHNNNPVELAKCIETVIDSKNELQEMAVQARKAYETYFSEDVFKSNLATILGSILSDSKEIAFNLMEYASQNPVRTIYGKEKLYEYDKNGQKNILLLSHELSLSGAPLVLYKMAEELRKQGNNVIIMSPFDGPLREKFVQYGFPVVLFEDIYDPASNDYLSRCGISYDLIIMNTVVTYRAIFQLENLQIPVIWWIHDSHASYTYGGFGSCLPATLPPNVKILCGGSYAKRQLLQFYPHYKADELLYAIDDCMENKKGIALRIAHEKRKIFLIVGTIERRKGQDIAVAAIRMLSETVRNKCLFVFMGKIIEPPIMEEIKSLCLEMPDHVRYMEPIPHDDLIALYRRSECLICSSRDDPMPVVVTEMQALSKPVICSENTGSAALIQKYGGGLVYSNDDPSALAEQISHVLEMRTTELSKIGKEARVLYESCFAETSFKEELQNLVTNECSVKRKCEMSTVSVVIPTYNAGTQFEEMLTLLNTQKGLARVEIIVVDSGSTDGTQKLAVDNGAKLIQITQESFSHSYARNLGASNASGQVLLFMTQDALPSSEKWVLDMVSPILTGECSAVSCREQCPESTDLYYRVAAWNHARYLGIDKESKSGKLIPGMSTDEFRRNASLNDISTAVDRNLFQQMGYRHSFAEDLDLGIRILQAGKTIKLLHEPTVIHGHTRAASYYLRRGLAEGRALERIMGVQEADISAKALAEMIVKGYGVLQNSIVQIQTGPEIQTASDFGSRFRQVIQCEMSNPQGTVYGQKGADAYVETCVQKLEAILPSEYGINFDLAHMVMYYWSNVLSICLEENNWIDKNMSEQICDCLYKQMSLVMGNLLAHMDPAESCFQEFQQLANGV